MKEDGYRLLKRKEYQLRNQFRKNSMQILKLQYENEKMFLEMESLIKGHEALYSERLVNASQKESTK